MSYKEATIGTCILGDGEQTDTLRVVFQERVDVRVARIFNTFGPRMHMADGRVVSNFILQALQNEPITVSRLLHAVSSCWGCSCLYGGGGEWVQVSPKQPVSRLGIQCNFPVYQILLGSVHSHTRLPAKYDGHDVSALRTICLCQSFHDVTI